MMEPKGRLLSLDVFRGLTIAGMILVNNPGSWGHLYPPLGHADWHGWTPTDLIFPFFLFIVGVAITFSLARYQEAGKTAGLYLRILRRTLLIFACGLFLSFFLKWDFSTLRIPGVLQRIAVCYFFAALITIRFTWRAIARWTAGLLAGYWLLLLLVPAPTAAQIADEKNRVVNEIPLDQVTKPSTEPKYLARECNLPAWLDRGILGRHTWKPDYDPEGILSTFPALATTLLGVLTGFWLRSRREPRETALGMFIAGCLLFTGGYAWSAVFPINKALWTSSYVLLTGGCALFFLGFCTWVVDGLGWKRWSKPFEVYGMNALFVFMMSGLAGRALTTIKVAGADGKELALRTWIYDNGYLTWLDGKNASLAFALTNVLVWLGVLWILYRRKIFVKL